MLYVYRLLHHRHLGNIFFTRGHLPTLTVLSYLDHLTNLFSTSHIKPETSWGQTVKSIFHVCGTGTLDSQTIHNLLVSYQLELIYASVWLAFQFLVQLSPLIPKSRENNFRQGTNRY